MGLKEKRKQRKEAKELKRKTGISVLDIDLDGDGDKERLLVKGATKSEKKLSRKKGFQMGFGVGRALQPFIDFVKKYGGRIFNFIKGFL